MNMREILQLLARRGWKSLAAVSLMICVSLFAQHELNLFGSVLVGYLLGGFYFVSIAGRLERIMNLVRSGGRQIALAKAKREMIFGLLLRLVMIFVCLMLTIKLSTKIFFAAVTGFLVVFALGMFFLCKISLESRIGRG